MRTGLDRSDFQRLYAWGDDPFGRDREAALVELELRGYAPCEMDLHRVRSDSDGGFSAAAIDELADVLEAERRFTPLAGACHCYSMSLVDFLERLHQTEPGQAEPTDIFAAKFTRDSERGAVVEFAPPVSGETPETVSGETVGAVSAETEV